jgi:hypothetical protein
MYSSSLTLLIAALLATTLAVEIPIEKASTNGNLARGVKLLAKGYEFSHPLFKREY